MAYGPFADVADLCRNISGLGSPTANNRWLWLAMAGMDAMGADAKSDTPAIQSPSVQ
ncbi:MAG: hypothetical protein WA888_23280 [Burkholderiaceae bacterium]